MNHAYSNCSNLATAVCGDNVIKMHNAYTNCINLTTAACGEKVESMYGSYRDCTNLTTAVCGNSVIYIHEAYQNCPNIQGNAYFYSTGITTAHKCFEGRNVSNNLSIYVPANSTTLTTILSTDNANSLVGADITWENDTTNNCYYNTDYNIYIYPVENVAAAKEINGD